jgi:Holliday junction DNA helicase RuvB
MNPYTVEELAIIVSQAAVRNNMTINQDAALSIAKRSRFTPATAMTFLRQCWYWKMAKDAPEINIEVVSATMEMLKIDENGLKYEDLKVLNALGNNQKGLGLSNLAGVSGVQKDVIEKIVEPFLKELGLMAVTSKRIITEHGLDYITKPEAGHG